MENKEEGGYALNLKYLNSWRFKYIDRYVEFIFSLVLIGLVIILVPGIKLLGKLRIIKLDQECLEIMRESWEMYVSVEHLKSIWKRLWIKWG